jgi:hypothetical protein
VERGDEAQESAPRPSIPFDYLSVADELHSGRIKVSEAVAGAQYRESAGSLEAELEALLGEAAAAIPDIGADDLPPVEPEALALELGLATAGPDDLGRLRRKFALKNHPDRVAPHLRQRALARMQLANRLIDEARRRALAKPKG